MKEKNKNSYQVIVASILLIGFFYYLYSKNNPSPVKPENTQIEEASKESDPLTDEESESVELMPQEVNKSENEVGKINKKTKPLLAEPLRKEVNNSKDIKGKIKVKEKNKKMAQLVAPSIVKINIPMLLDFVKVRGIASVNVKPKSYPQLVWSKVKYARHYLVEISNNINFRRKLESKVSRTNSFLWKNPMPGQFYWRVKAIGVRDSSFSSTGEFIVQLPPPELLIQSDNLIEVSSLKELKKTDVNIDLTWEPSPLSQGVHLLVSPDNNFKKVLFSEKIITNKVNVKLKKNKKYYTKVAAIDEKERLISSYSKPQKFVIKKALKLLSPEIIGPKDRLSLSIKDPKQVYILFKWKKVKYAKSYDIQFSIDPEFNKILLDRRVETLKYIHRTAFPVGAVYWRLRSKGSSGISSWSSAQTLTIEK